MSGEVLIPSASQQQSSFRDPKPTEGCVQISAGQKLTGRTCATALSACVRQGMIWVYPSPGPAPSKDTIPGDACKAT